MAEFEEKLNAILSNPQAMAQIAGLAQSLDLGGASGGSAGSGEQTDSPEAGGGPPQADAGRPAVVSGEPPGNAGGPGGLGDLLGQVDPKWLQRLLPLVGELSGNSGSDERLALLYALRPFLRPERRDKVERAVKAARLIHVGKQFLMTLGDGHV